MVAYAQLTVCADKIIRCTYARFLPLSLGPSSLLPLSRSVLADPEPMPYRLEHGGIAQAFTEHFRTRCCKQPWPS